MPSCDRRTKSHLESVDPEDLAERLLQPFPGKPQSMRA